MYRPPLNTCPPNPDSRRPPRPGGRRTSAGSCCRNCSRWVGIFAVRLLAPKPPKPRRGGAAKSHPSLCGSWLLASRAYSSRGGLLTAMIRCRYQELDLAECHAVVTAVCHCAAASAHCRQTGLRRLGTDGSQTPRRRGESRANQSLKWVFRGPGNYGPIPRRLWDGVGSVRAPFRPGSAGILVFVPRLGSPAISF